MAVFFPSSRSRFTPKARPRDLKASLQCASMVYGVMKTFDNSENDRLEKGNLKTNLYIKI
jgi:hypothetical protein